MAGGGDSGPGLSPSPSAAQFQTMFARRPLTADATFDITAMIDLVFMMNIFFLVTTLTAALAELDLPSARNTLAADANDCVVVLVSLGSQPDCPLVWIGDQKTATSDPDEQAERVREAVEQGVQARKTKVLIKAEKRVRLKDIARLSSIVSSVDGTELLLGVMELERKE
jgi:biopolymer transport protein ExbD